MIHRLVIPTPFRIGPVNCYLIEDDPLTLVDTGPNSGTSLVALEAGLRDAGHPIEEVERIVITHQHMDHMGLVGVLAERSGADVCVLDALAPVVEDFPAYAERDDALASSLMLRHGVPPDAVTALVAMSRTNRGWGGSAPVGRRLGDGGELEFASRSFEVQHRPGHSPSDTVFYDRAAGILLTGDHLLKTVSSNPLIAYPLDGATGERPRALLAYIESMRATRELPVAEVLPGHGEPFADHVTLIDERFAMHERRARRFAALIAQQPRSAHEIAQETWGNVAITQAYLTLCEVLGHLDMLVARGEVVEVTDGDVAVWEPAR